MSHSNYIANKQKGGGGDHCRQSDMRNVLHLSTKTYNPTVDGYKLKHREQRSAGIPEYCPARTAILIPCYLIGGETIDRSIEYYGVY